MKSTIFTLNTLTNVHYIDYDDQDNDYPYSVYTNDVFRRNFQTYGEALQFIFEKQGSVDFYSKDRVNKMVQLQLEKA